MKRPARLWTVDQGRLMKFQAKHIRPVGAGSPVMALLILRMNILQVKQNGGTDANRSK